jgi:hypothetical protein
MTSNGSAVDFMDAAIVLYRPPIRLTARVRSILGMRWPGPPPPPSASRPGAQLSEELRDGGADLVGAVLLG